MNKVFITGASGFVGSHLCARLIKAGYEVTGFIRPTSNLRLFEKLKPIYGIASDPHWVVGNMEDADSVVLAMPENVWVVHAAAMVSYAQKDKSQLFRSNVLGTRNVINAALLKKALHFIHIGSIAALGRSKANEPIAENAEFSESKYNTYYAQTKYLSELEVWRGKEEGLTINIINPGIILGETLSKKGSGTLWYRVQKGMPFYPKGSNGFIDVKDLTELLLVLLSKVGKNEEYEKVTAVTHQCKYAELLSQIALKLDKKAASKILTDWQLTLLWRIAKFLEFFNLPTPYPSQGIISTSFDSLYQNKQCLSLLNHQTININDTIDRCVAFIKVNTLTD